MDEETLINAFQTSLSIDANLRTSAYNYIESIKYTQNLIPLLIKISLASPNLEVQQLSVIYLKNLTKN